MIAAPGAGVGQGVHTTGTPADATLLTVHEAEDVSRNAARAADAYLALAQARRASLAAQASAIEAEELRILEQRRAEEEARVAAEAAAIEEAARFLATKGYTQGTVAPKEIGRQMALNLHGWGADQFACFDQLIMSESKWDPHADNPSSSAYGIPQALPGKKMASEGSDWQTNPATQIRWGLKYVKSVYGTPCKAWSFKRSHNWY